MNRFKEEGKAKTKLHILELLLEMMDYAQGINHCELNSKQKRISRQRRATFRSYLPSKIAMCEVGSRLSAQTNSQRGGSVVYFAASRPNGTLRSQGGGSSDFLNSDIKLQANIKKGGYVSSMITNIAKIMCAKQAICSNFTRGRFRMRGRWCSQGRLLNFT